LEPQSRLQRAAETLRRGGIIAYPTEAVYGLGCDPANEEALARLLKLKQRPAAKGLILIGGEYFQLSPWIESLPDARRKEILASWPGPTTWLVPARPHVSRLLRGEHSTLAVRVTAHPLVQALCRAFGGAIVSTSANPAGAEPFRALEPLREHFQEQIDYYLSGALGGRDRPSTIRDALTGKVIRA